MYLSHAAPDTANARCPAPGKADEIARSAETEILETFQVWHAGSRKTHR